MCGALDCLQVGEKLGATVGVSVFSIGLRVGVLKSDVVGAKDGCTLGGFVGFTVGTAVG